MTLCKTWLAFLAATFLFAAVCAAAKASMALHLEPDGNNPLSPVMGDHLRFHSTIANTGATPVEGLVAWISLVEIDPGNEQPVDLEDWSAQKAVAGARIEPGGSLRTEWPMRLIKGGDYRVAVSVTDRSGRQVFTSPAVQFHVQQKAVLETRRVLPVAAGFPLLVIGLMAWRKAKGWGKR